MAAPASASCTWGGLLRARWELPSGPCAALFGRFRQDLNPCGTVLRVPSFQPCSFLFLGQGKAVTVVETQQLSPGPFGFLPRSSAMFHVEHLVELRLGCSTWNNQVSSGSDVPRGTLWRARDRMFHVEHSGELGTGCFTWNTQESSGPDVPRGTLRRARVRMFHVEHSGELGTGCSTWNTQLSSGPDVPRGTLS
ncbi:MAG: hypothetical protein ACI8QC_000873 [Planctomycetota bacterium]|jgi:hypothetical protein